VMCVFLNGSRGRDIYLYMYDKSKLKELYAHYSVHEGDFAYF